MRQKVRFYEAESEVMVVHQECWNMLYRNFLGYMFEFVAAGFQEHAQDHAFASENMPCPIEEGCR